MSAHNCRRPPWKDRPPTFVRKAIGFMPYIPILPPDKAPEDVNKVYEEFYRRMSFPSAPNFITTQGHSSTVVRGSWEAVRHVLVTGVPPRWQKEVMFVASL